MSSDNNILIEIKSAFEKSGTDAAERAQDRLASKTKDLNRTFQDNEKDTNRARQALSAMTAVSAASQGSFSGLSRVLEGFSGRLADLAGKASLVAGAFTAGYGTGQAIAQYTGLDKVIQDLAEKLLNVENILSNTHNRIRALDSASLAAVKKEFDSLTESLNSTRAQLDAVNRVKNQLMGQETEAQLAELEANMPPGPARDRALLDARRNRQQASIEERRNQARAKFSAAEQAKAGGEAALWNAESAEGDARKKMMLAKSAGDYNGWQSARTELTRAESVSATAQARMDQLAEAFSQALMEKANSMRSLALEERTSSARYSSGVNALDFRAREEAQRLATRRQGIREGVSNDMRGISSDATRSALESQLGDLSSRADTLRTQAMPAARVQDLRSKASGASNQADSAVAAVSAVLDSITARMKSLEDKLKNLPR